MILFCSNNKETVLAAIVRRCFSVNKKTDELDKVKNKNTCFKLEKDFTCMTTTVISKYTRCHFSFEK